MTFDERARAPDAQAAAGARRVAILHYAGPPGIGGVEATIAAHAQALAADGRAVRIVSGHSALDVPGVAVLNNPALGSRGPQPERIAAGGVASPAFGALVDEVTIWLAEALAGVDVAFVHNVLTLHKNLAFTAALRRLHDQGRAPRLVAWCHDFAWRDPLYAPELHAGPPWDLLHTPWPGVQYVAVSADRRAILAGMLGLAAEDVALVSPGVDLAAFLKLEADTVALCERLGLLAASPLLLLPARITRRKNIELAVQIVAALGRLGLAPRLVVTGPPGPHNPANAAYLARLEALRDEAGAGNAVVFLHQRFRDAAGQPRPVSDAMLADFFRLADALLFPSAYEGFGIPIIEAGLAGLPIFCSDIAPFREIAGGEITRFGLSEPPDAIAARLAEALRASPQARLRQRVRHRYTWDAIYRHAVVPLLRDPR